MSVEKGKVLTSEQFLALRKSFGQQSHVAAGGEVYPVDSKSGLAMVPDGRGQGGFSFVPPHNCP